jgi:hypothetical protein
MKTIRIAVFVAAFTIAWASSAKAGRSCEEKPLSVATLESGLNLAQRTAHALDASGARAVVLARAGQNLSRHGLAWSHVALTYRDAVSGHWRVVHKLNHCGTAHADVYRQGLGEFFLDDPWRYEAAFVALKPAWQDRVRDLLADDARATRLHTRAYNLVAYPWAQRYQQSNQWAIETLALAIDPAASTRARAQAWLQLRDYQPTTLRIDAFERLAARIGTANVAFDDHPNRRRFTDRIDTVTADSVLAWLQRSGLGEPLQVVR